MHNSYSLPTFTGRRRPVFSFSALPGLACLLAFLLLASGCDSSGAPGDQPALGTWAGPGRDGGRLFLEIEPEAGGERPGANPGANPGTSVQGYGTIERSSGERSRYTISGTAEGRRVQLRLRRGSVEATLEGRIRERGEVMGAVVTGRPFEGEEEEELEYRLLFQGGRGG